MIGCSKDDVTPSYTVTISVDANLNSVHEETWSVRIIGDNGKQIDIEKTQDHITKGGAMIFFKDGSHDLPYVLSGKITTFTNVPKGRYFIYVFGGVYQNSHPLSLRYYHYSKWIEVGNIQEMNVKIEFPEGENIVHE